MNKTGPSFSKSTLERKDQEIQEGKIISKSNELFGKENVTRHEDYVEKYENLLNENQLLFTIDLIKTKLSDAYACAFELEMAKSICEIIDFCTGIDNAHLKWFDSMLESHFDGIISNAAHHISSGKIEGINNKIKTLRLQGYGYPDDEYFFIKLIDVSRNVYTAYSTPPM